MSKLKRDLLILAVFLVLAGLWTWRYTTLNAYYHGIAGEEERVEYSIGDVVPITDLAEGYSIRVDGIEIVEPEDIAPELLAESDAVNWIDETRYLLLSITLFNDGGEAEGVDLRDLTVRGEDSVISADWGLLRAMNEGSYGLRLSPGTEYSLVVPFWLWQRLLPGAWNHLDRYTMYLCLSLSAEIRVQ